METFDDVAFSKVMIVFKSHAAFLTGLDVFNLVLKAFQGRELTFMDHNIITDKRIIMSSKRSGATADNLAHS